MQLKQIIKQLLKFNPEERASIEDILRVPIMMREISQLLREFYNFPSEYKIICS